MPVTPGTPPPSPFPDDDPRLSWLSEAAIGPRVPRVDAETRNPLDGEGNQLNATAIEAARDEAQAARDAAVAAAESVGDPLTVASVEPQPNGDKLLTLSDGTEVLLPAGSANLESAIGTLSDLHLTQTTRDRLDAVDVIDARFVLVNGEVKIGTAFLPKISTAQLPVWVADEAAMLALVYGTEIVLGQRVIRGDLTQNVQFQLQGEDPSDIDNWVQEVSTPGTYRVNGLEGAEITLTPADVGAATSAQGAKADAAVRFDAAQALDATQRGQALSNLDLRTTANPSPDSGIHFMLSQEGVDDFETLSDTKALLGVTELEAQVVGGGYNPWDPVAPLTFAEGAVTDFAIQDALRDGVDPSLIDLVLVAPASGVTLFGDGNATPYTLSFADAVTAETTVTVEARTKDGMTRKAVSFTYEVTGAAVSSAVSQTAWTAWYEADGTAVLKDRTGTYTASVRRGTPLVGTNATLGDVVRLDSATEVTAHLGVDHAAEADVEPEVTLYLAAYYRGSGTSTSGESKFWECEDGAGEWQFQHARGSTEAMRIFAQSSGTEGGEVQPWGDAEDAVLLMLARRRDTGNTVDDGAGGQRKVYVLEARTNRQASWVTLVADSQNPLSGWVAVLGGAAVSSQNRPADMDVARAARATRAVTDAEADELLSAPPLWADMAP